MHRGQVKIDIVYYIFQELRCNPQFGYSVSPLVNTQQPLVSRVILPQAVSPPERRLVHAQGVLVFTHFIFWPWFSGLIFLAAGVFAVRRELVTARGLDKLIALGRVFLAAPLAVFGAEHIVGAQFVKSMIPQWMPMHLFWAYFVGF